MDGRQKVATLLLALDPDVAGELLGRFGEQQRAELVEAMLAMDYVGPATVKQVLTEFEEACGQELRPIAEPRVRARRIVAKALGEGDAEAYLGEHDPAAAADPFAALERLELSELVSLLSDEHPQTIAIVLSRLGAERAGAVLSALPDELANDVVARIVSCEQAAPAEVVERIGQVLGERVQAMASTRDPWATPDSRFRLVADVLTAATRSARDAALEAVRTSDPEAGERVREFMFLFEDLTRLKADDLRKVVSALDTKVVAMALKTASDEVKEAIVGAISSRAADTLQEETELLGPQPLSEVEEAQRTMVATVLRLQEEGEVTVSRGSEEEMV